MPKGRRISVCLNGLWERCAGDDRRDPDDPPHDGWTPVRVPEAHQSALRGSAWLRLRAQIPECFAPADRLLLRFIRVRHYARVFVNGVRCGQNYGQRAPFEIDISQAARVGCENEILVWVHECSGECAAQGRSFTDRDEKTVSRLATAIGYRDAATIAEDVFLVGRPAVFISRVLIQTSVRNRSITVHVHLRNEGEEALDLGVDGDVYLGGTPILSLPPQRASLEPGQTRVVTAVQEWNDATLWGHGPYGSPVLYHLCSRLTDTDDGPIDRLVTRFGFREIWTEGGKILLNGKEIRILGYWQPEASGRSTWTLRALSVLACGCNAIHNHLEQKDPAFYEVADELGLLVWDANYCGGPLGASEAWMESASVHFPCVESELARQYPLHAEAVANHPSVVIFMAGCLLESGTVSRLARVYAESNPNALQHPSGGRATAPMELASYASSIKLLARDPTAELRETHGQTGQLGVRDDGLPVPVVNKEIWYDRRTEAGYVRVTDEKVARATEDAMAYLTSVGLPGYILYGQEAFAVPPGIQDSATSWPSLSGLGQHASGARTGGLHFRPFEYVNLFAQDRSPFVENAVCLVMKQESRRYLGYELPSPVHRRPEVLVRVVSNRSPVPDVYVFAAAVAGTVEEPPAMRTDPNGLAWFQLREAGRYRFECTSGGRSAHVQIDCPPMRIDHRRGGLGTPMGAELRLG